MFDQFWGANVCFIIASVFVFAKVAQVAITAPDPTWERFVFTFLLFGVLGIGIVESVRGVNRFAERKRQTELVASSQPNVTPSKSEAKNLPTSGQPPTEKPIPTGKDDKDVPGKKAENDSSATPIVFLEMNPEVPPSDCPHVLFLEPLGGGVSGMWIEELSKNIPTYDSHGNLYLRGPLSQKWTALNPGKDTLLNVSVIFPVVFAETQDFNKKPDGQAKVEIGALSPNAPYVFVIGNRSHLWARIMKPHATFDLNVTLRDRPLELVLSRWGQSVGSGFFPPSVPPTATLTPRNQQ